MNTRFALVLAALGVSLPMGRAAAQQFARTLRRGQDVRVTAPTAGLDRSGVVYLGVRGDSVLFARFERREFSGDRWTDTIPVTLPLAALTRLEAHNRVTWQILVGLVAGTAAGWALLSHPVTNACSGSERIFPSADCYMGIMLVPACGALTGAIVEALFPEAGWTSLPLGSVRVGIVPQTGSRLGLGASLAF